MKEEISKSYIDKQIAEHGDKFLRFNREFLVTGVAPGNIGEAIAERIESIGSVVRVGREDYDLSIGTQVSKMIDKNNTVDTLILCHGYTSLDWIENQPSEMIHRIVDSSLTSHIDLVSIFAHKSKHQNYKKIIIIIGSMAANSVLNGSAPYCAAKAGLQHFVKCAAWELTPKGFDIFLLNPGNVPNTPMAEKTIRELALYRKMSPESAREYWSASNPRTSFMSKGEISDLVHYLSAGGCRYMSGSAINLSGGQR